MNSESAQESLKQLGGSISDLEKQLQPLLTSALSESTKKLPLLDRAKLYITVVYTIESLIFCRRTPQTRPITDHAFPGYLRLHGVDVKNHAVFQELTRIKQYFAKIQKAEERGPAAAAKRQNLNLDKQAAGRIINHALAGNKKFDLELAERKAKELLIAKRKLQELEDRRRTKLLQQQQQQQSTPTSAPDSSAAPSPAELSTSPPPSTLTAKEIAQIKQEAQAEVAAEVQAQSLAQISSPAPSSPAPSTDGSVKSGRKSKKRALGAGDTSSPLKKKKKTKPQA
jgi:exosome complex protein LRP1